MEGGGGENVRTCSAPASAEEKVRLDLGVE